MSKPYKPAWFRRWTVTTFIEDFGHTRMGPYYLFKFQAELYAHGIMSEYVPIRCKELDRIIEIERKTRIHNIDLAHQEVLDELKNWEPEV